MHDIFKDILAPIFAPAKPDPVSDLGHAYLELLRLRRRIAELDAMLERLQERTSR